MVYIREKIISANFIQCLFQKYYFSEKQGRVTNYEKNSISYMLCVGIDFKFISDRKPCICGIFGKSNLPFQQVAANFCI